VPVRLSPALVAGGGVGGSGQVSHTAPAISPDSSTVAFLADAVVDDRFELYVAPIDGSRAATRVNGPPVLGGDVLDFAFAAGGERIVYYADEEVDQRFELYSAPLHSRFKNAGLGGPRSQRVKLNSPLAGAAIVGTGCCGGSAFTLSPDGSVVAFEAGVPFTSSALFVVPVDRSTPPLQLTSGDFAQSSWTFTSDGSRIVYTAFSAASGIYSVFVDGSQAPVRLTDEHVEGASGSDEAPFRLSPDGQSLVYRGDPDVADRFDLYARPLDASAPAVRMTQPFTSGSVQPFPYLAFTPDSARIVYRADHAGPGVVELYSSPMP